MTTPDKKGRGKNVVIVNNDVEAEVNLPKGWIISDWYDCLDTFHIGQKSGLVYYYYHCYTLIVTGLSLLH